MVRANKSIAGGVISRILKRLLNIEESIEEIKEQGVGGTAEVELTLAEYEALGDVVNNDDVTYFIKDSNGSGNNGGGAFDITLDFSKASSNVQDLNTFLQKALEKLFPARTYLFESGVGSSYAWNGSSYHSDHASFSSSVTNDTLTLVSNGRGSYGNHTSLISSVQIDTTGFDYLTFEVCLSSSALTSISVGLFSNSPNGQYSGVVPTGAKLVNVPYNASYQEVTVNVSTHQAPYYIGVVDQGLSSGTITIKNISLHN